jgi:GDP/UDP-N,N'-diacetylbacillosamine 2-epimerase (hydrolysing)
MAHGDRSRICFVTGTRAEFGLMRSTLVAIRDNSRLQLQIVATGMHLDRARGHSIDAIRADGWRVDCVVPWDGKRGATRAGSARCTGSAMAGIAAALEELDSDIVLVVGDRVEAFAAAAAGHISGRAVAHVHGGDRAAGQVDDALRHAITKLAHVHFPATAESASRIAKLGEDRWRIKHVGSPGIDGITREAATRRNLAAEVGPLDWRRYALLLLHPVDADQTIERERAEAVLKAVGAVPFPQIVIIYPNNDPGSSGIVEAWEGISHDHASAFTLPGDRGDGQGLPGRPSGTARKNPSLRDGAKRVVENRETEKRADAPRGDAGRFVIRPDVPRPVFLGLLRDAAGLVGNSSSGIIEAASFGTPVIDIGPRQKGREHGSNVTHVPYVGPALRRALDALWNDGNPRRAGGANVYGSSGAGERIATALAGLQIDDRLLRKLIAY